MKQNKFQQILDNSNIQAQQLFESFTLPISCIRNNTQQFFFKNLTLD